MGFKLRDGHFEITVCVDMPKAEKPAASRHRSTEQLACGDWQKPDSHRSILIVHTALLERELQLLEYCPRALMLYLLSPATQSYLVCKRCLVNNLWL